MSSELEKKQNWVKPKCSYFYGKIHTFRLSEPDRTLPKEWYPTYIFYTVLRGTSTCLILCDHHFCIVQECSYALRCQPVSSMWNWYFMPTQRKFILQIGTISVQSWLFVRHSVSCIAFVTTELLLLLSLLLQTMKWERKEGADWKCWNTWEPFVCLLVQLQLAWRKECGTWICRGKGAYMLLNRSRVSRPQPGCHYQTLPGRE